MLYNVISCPFLSIEGPFQSTELIHCSKKPLFTSEECDAIVSEAEQCAEVRLVLSRDARSSSGAMPMRDSPLRIRLGSKSRALDLCACLGPWSWDSDAGLPLISKEEAGARSGTTRTRPQTSECKNCLQRWLLLHNCTTRALQCCALRHVFLFRMPPQFAHLAILG